MAGSLYIWIMLGFFLATAGIILFLAGVFWIGHWIERRQTGATHGFLELPHELRPPAGDANQTSDNPAAPTGQNMGDKSGDKT